MKRSKRQYIYIILTIFTLILTAITYMAPHAMTPRELAITNVQPNSPRIVKDDGSIEFADNLRIRNMTDHPYDLKGLFLSDKRSDLKKLPLDGIVIEPQDSVLIKLDPSWNFGLRSKGDEDVYLSDDRGNILFRYTPSMKPKEPVLSATSGFYDNEFNLSISDDSKYRIYYTLDGSNPDETSIPYTGPIHVYDRSSEPNSVVNAPNVVEDYLDDIDEEDIYIDKNNPRSSNYFFPINDPVDKAFVVRAVAVDEYDNLSDIVTGVYFFCKDKYKNVLSIVANGDDLFGDYGILSVGKEYNDWYLGDREGDGPKPNFRKKGRDWEVPAQVDLFIDGDCVMGNWYGMRLFGRGTRTYRIKNFQLYSRNVYNGSDVFQYQFFDDDKYLPDKITLDDSFKESLFFDIIKDENIVKQHTTGRVALFLNGEFYNNIYIRQKIDQKYFEDHFGINKDNLLIIKESLVEYGAEDDDSFGELRDRYLLIDRFAKENDLSDLQNYEKLQTMMDMDSYIDYLAINTWAGCTDWGEFCNDRCWCVKEPYDANYGDGRFRWIIHDGDTAFNDTVSIEDEDFVNDSVLISNLMKSNLFRKELAERLEELGKTSFSDENIERTLHSGKWDETQLATVEAFLLNQKNKMSEVITELLIKEP